MGLKRRAALLIAAAALAGCGGGDEPADPADERLRSAEVRLADRPEDPRALEAVVRAAVAGAQANVDPETATPGPDGRRFAERAAEAWPRYVKAAGGRPSPDIANLMSLIYAQFLKDPRGAAEALLYATEARPSAEAYVRLVAYYTQAGDQRAADLAARKALELASDNERSRVREYIRQARELKNSGSG